MVLAEGLFCPEVEQRCLADGAEGSQCQRYAQPSRCLSAQRELMRVCIDRFEWPNRLGQKPLVLVSFAEAVDHCEAVGKRLCEEKEWLLACEGEPMLPYAYGFDRDPTKCVIDRLFTAPQTQPSRYDSCMESEACRKAFESVDQREPSGSFRSCLSSAGAFDMNGNVNEWVRLAGEKTPSRSGLKGGWWGPGADRCRPTDRSRKEDDWGYEIGFRCCRNAQP